MKTYTKESLIQELQQILEIGWHESIRTGKGRNDGSVGNTLEQLLGIEENNLPIPNASEWELKAQRINTSSLTTLFHMEPSPRALKFIPSILLPIYGWEHQEAGEKHSKAEKSFRQTINANSFSSRGFSVFVNREEEKIEIIFDSERVDESHQGWLSEVIEKGGKTLPETPYWGFKDIFHKVGSKLHNCFFIQAESKQENNKEYFYYKNILMLKNISLEKFIDAIESGYLYIDFDARTGHNHGTKFRIREKSIPDLYETSISY